VGKEFEFEAGGSEPLSLFSLIPTFLFATRSHILSLSLSRILCFHFLSLQAKHVVLSKLSMALQSFSPIPSLLRSSNGSFLTQPPPLKLSILTSSNGRLFIDFIGLHCKSKRTRWKFVASNSPRFPSFSLVKVVLDLSRIEPDACSDSIKVGNSGL
jgi:hypothetical protein